MDARVLEAHDKPLVFSFPDLDEDLRTEALEKHDRHGAAFLAAQSGGANPPPKADTLGWDTVFAIRMIDVNKAIVKQKTTPPTFSASNPLGEGSSLSGSFAAWPTDHRCGWRKCQCAGACKLWDVRLRRQELRSDRRDRHGAISSQCDPTECASHQADKNRHQAQYCCQ